MDEVTLAPNYRPKKKEPFMNPRQREYFRRKLLAWKENILMEARQRELGRRDAGAAPGERPKVRRGRAACQSRRPLARLLTGR